MATCEQFQPMVLLSNLERTTHSNQEEPSCSWFKLEQTEPLDLCLNGSFPDHLTTIDTRSKQKNDETDDDVIFVKEYTVDGNQAEKKQKTIVKGAPRRNPVRKARVSKRFKEYSQEADLIEEYLEDENSSVNDKIKCEDCDDWKVEDCAKKGRSRRRVMNRKMTGKLGRKRKLVKVDEEDKKVDLKELEALVEDNISLLKDYVGNIKTVNELCQGTEENVHKTRIESALNIMRQQLTLFCVVKSSECDVSKYI